MMKNFFAVICCFLWLGAIAQNVGINTPSPTSSLDVNGGLRLRPAVTTVSGASVILANNRTHHVLSGTPTGDFTISIAGATTEGQHLIITNGTLFNGFLAPISILPNTTVELIYSSAAWKQIGSNEPLSATAWSRSGNGGTIDGVNNLFGTTDNKPIRFIIDNFPSGLMDAVKYNYFIGDGAGFSNGLGNDNAGFGSRTLRNNISGDYNTAVGSLALSGNKGGSSATAVGYRALGSDTAADGTVAIGAYALNFNMARQGNTAVGSAALFNNCNPVFGPIEYFQGMNNTALGNSALYNNVSGSGNVAIGYRAAFDKISGYNTIAIGQSAAYSNISGDGTIAIGGGALYSNKDRIGNIAIGESALYSNGEGATGINEGNYNVAIGSSSLLLNTKGYSNTGLGFQVLRSNTIGSGNTAIGTNTLYFNNGNDNTAIGNQALEQNLNGTGNIAIGAKAGRFESTSNKLYIENSDANKDNALIYGDFAADSLLLNAKTVNKFSLNVRGNNALEMGYGAPGKQTDAGKVCYGCFGDPAHWLGIVGGGLEANNGNDRVIKLWSEGGLRIRGNALPDANNVYTLGTSGQRWREVWTNAGAINTSDANLKTNIANSPYGLNEIMQMNPVQYNWKSNPTEDLQIGFLAQDIQKIIPEAVVVPENGDPLGMKYTELIPVLVKAIQELKEENEQYKKRIEKLEAIKK